MGDAASLDAACALLSHADSTPLSPDAAAALELLASAAKAAPADALEKHPLLVRSLGALVAADHAVAPMRALAALLRAAPRKAARDAAAELHACGALGAACDAFAAPLERNAAAFALAAACCAAHEASAPHAAAVKEALTEQRALLALVGALGGAGEPRVSASAASCVAALASSFDGIAERLCLPAAPSALADGITLWLLIALASHPDEAPQRVLEGRCADGVGVGGPGAAARDAACDALHACFAASPAVAKAAGAQRGAVASLLRALERTPEEAGSSEAASRALLALFDASADARAEVARAPSLAVRIAKLAVGSSMRSQGALALLQRIAAEDEPAAHIALAAARSVPGCLFAAPASTDADAVFTAATETEARARRGAAKRMSDLDAHADARQRAARSYDGSLMMASVRALTDSQDTVALDAVLYRLSFAYFRAHLLAQRAAMIAAWGAETPALVADAEVAAFGCVTTSVLPMGLAAVPGGPMVLQITPCFAHTLGLGVSVGAGGELLVKSAGQGWMAPLLRAIADAAGAEALACASGMAADPLYDRGATEFALPETWAGCLRTLYVGLGAGEVPPAVAVAASALTWRFALPTSPECPTAELLTQTKRTTAKRLHTTACGCFYMTYAGVAHRELYRLKEQTQLCDADACIAAAGPEHAQTLRDALKALLCGGGEHDACNCAKCEEARALGAMCAQPGCGVAVRLRRCGGCKQRAYCTAEHQSAHWAQHKAECLAARGAGKGDAAAPADDAA